jgi:glucan phosphoethanolaminetransferase (alkaline phosphatase superfamily)
MAMDSLATPRMAGRRFTLLDTMILVAATACGLGVDGALNALIRSANGLDSMDMLGSLFGARKYPVLAVLSMMMTMPVAAAWTLALVPLGLLRPRPRLRRLARQPGWMAACAFSLALAFSSVVFVGLVAVIGPTQSIALIDVSPLLAIIFAPAIGATWLSLIVGRRWRPERSWLDRSGRALGVFWIVLGIAGPVILGLAFF